jgi:hypothetical protein
MSLARDALQCTWYTHTRQPHQHYCKTAARIPAMSIQLASNVNRQQCDMLQAEASARCAPSRHHAINLPVPILQCDMRDADVHYAPLVFAAHCWEKNAWKSFGYLALDVAIVFGMAIAAYTVNQPWLWPLYWFAQGTMFWALFVVGHDW